MPTAKKNYRAGLKPAVPGAAQLKEVIRARWSVPERVGGWTASGLNADFADERCRLEWSKALARAAAGSALRTALDIGTGPGTIAQFWAELGYQTTGLDFSPAMLDAARQAASAKSLPMTFIEGDAEAPPFPRKRFDIISSRFVLFTLPHPGYAVRRWTQMLQPGGCLVLIGHHHVAGLSPLRQRQQRPVPSSKVDQKHREALQYLPFMNHTPGDLQVVMEAAGLKDIRRIPVEELVAARVALRRRKRLLGIPLSTPFILVGRK